MGRLSSYFLHLSRAGALWVWAAATAGALAQTYAPATLDGYIRTDGALPTSLVVEARDLSTGSLVGYGAVGLDGSFHIGLRNPKEGQYQLRVLASDGQVLHLDQTWFPPMTPVTLNLPAPEPGASGAVPGQVSVAQLRHAPPPKALRQFALAQEAQKEGDLEGAAKRLRKALEIHPEYIEAHNNLGVLHVRGGRFDRAIEEFEKALELDPHSVLALINLSAALRSQGELQAAETAARRAVDLQPSSPQAQFSLGVVLWNLDEDAADAVAALRRASSEIPEAGLLATDILLRQGRVQDARTELRRFLGGGASTLN